MGPRLIKMDSLEISRASFYVDNEPNRTDYWGQERHAISAGSQLTQLS